LCASSFLCIHESKLDNRSRDLRDYLNDPRFLNRKTQLSQLASSDLLDVTRSDFKLGRKLRRDTEIPETPATPEDFERARLLRRLETNCACRVACVKPAKLFVAHSTCSHTARG
jgi:hypothetical protein